MAHPMIPNFKTGKWLRRAASSLAAAWFLFATTGPLLIRTGATSGNFPCAVHSCACQSAAQCAATCCCFPAPDAATSCPMHAQTASEPVDPSDVSLRVAHCTGGDDTPAITRHGLGPCESYVTVGPSETHPSVRWIVLPPAFPASPDLDALEKVPISLS